MDACLERGGDTIAKYTHPGVSLHKATGRWTAQFRGRYFGLHDTEAAAFAAYVRAFRAEYADDVPGWKGWTPDLAAGFEQLSPTPKAL